MDVRSPGFIALGSIFALTLTCGCDRGAHPANADKVAPDFTVSDGENTIHLANYRGKVVLLNFWWSQCPPCVQETPALEQLHRDKPDLAILAVSIDSDPGIIPQVSQPLSCEPRDRPRSGPDSGEDVWNRGMARDLHHRPQRRDSQEDCGRSGLVKSRDPQIPQ